MTRPARASAVLLEVLMALLVVAGFAGAVGFLLREGYLPPPLGWNVGDSLMDWFNTAYWANNPGAFTVWRTIYPPLSFVFLDTFSLADCYRGSALHARDCDWLGRWTIYAFYVLDVVLAWLAFRQADRSTAPMRTTAFAVGLPLLYAVERGNLVIVAFPFFVIAHSEIVLAPLWRGLASAVTINFKPYLLLPVLALAWKRDWRALELAGFATLALYLATLALFGSGLPTELVENAAVWMEYQRLQVFGEVHMSTSYAPFLNLLTVPQPVPGLYPFLSTETIAWAVPTVIRASQCAALVALIAAWLQPGAVSASRISTILIGAYLVTQSPGGYALAFLAFLVFLEPLRRSGPILAIVCAYALCLVSDLALSPVVDASMTSWLTDRPVTPSLAFSLGHLLRPALVVMILWALALDTVAQAARAYRASRPSQALRRA